jgi:hypothetical protein
MSLATNAARQNLDSHSILKDYNRTKSEFISLARVAYAAIAGKMGTAPSELDLLAGLTKIIRYQCSAFTAMRRRRVFLHPDLWDIFADILARIVLDDEWKTVTS